MGRGIDPDTATAIFLEGCSVGQAGGTSCIADLTEACGTSCACGGTATMVPLTVMKDHRVRLDDSELALCAAALRARAAGVSLGTALRCLALAERLGDSGPGNPHFRFTADARTRKQSGALRSTSAP